MRGERAAVSPGWPFRSVPRSPIGGNGGTGTASASLTVEVELARSSPVLASERGAAGSSPSQRLNWSSRAAELTS